MKYLFSIAAIFATASSIHLSKDEEPKVAQFVRDMWAECDQGKDGIHNTVEEFICSENFIDDKSSRPKSEQ